MIPVLILIVKSMAIPPGTLERQGNQAPFAERNPFETERRLVHQICLVGEYSVGKVSVSLLYHGLDLLYHQFVFISVVIGP